MELTKEQIQQINRFLEAIGIRYLDIRFEMLDHIASEIETKVNDKEAFFKKNGFKTPFIRFMLSKKQQFLKTYRRQVKNIWKQNCKTFFTEIFTKVIQPKTFLTILSLFTFLYFIGTKHTKAISIFIFSLLILYIFISAYNISKFTKKYKDVKLVNTYIFLSTFIIIIPLNFPNLLDVFYLGNYKESYMYGYFFALIFSYLLNQVFYDKKKKIEAKYNFLVSN